MFSEKYVTHKELDIYGVIIISVAIGIIAVLQYDLCMVYIGKISEFISIFYR